MHYEEKKLFKKKESGGTLYSCDPAHELMQ